MGGAPVGRITNTGAVRFYVKDHLGSTRTVVNSAGTVVETRDFYPFGLQMPGRTYLSGTAAKEDFTGHELDAETGLHYAGARYLDAAIGRWLAVDPLADEFPAWSPYNYAMNSPILFLDPDGMAVDGGCPPCERTVRTTFGWAEDRFNNTIQSLDRTIESGIEGIVKKGPETLDGITYAATYVAVAAGGAALVAGPSMDDLGHASIATASLAVANASNVTATVLSAIDAAYYGGSVEEATFRAQTTIAAQSVAGIAGITLAAPILRVGLREIQHRGLSTAVKAASGAATSEILEVLREEDETTKSDGR